MPLDTFFIQVGTSSEVIAERDFYRTHFGMSLVGSEDDDDYVFLTNGRIKLGFLYGDRPQDPNLINVGITVENLEAEVARLEAEGLVFTVPPETFHWGRAAALRDPSGIGVWLIEAR
jgi:predicted enzyme related to lactoylglutathione lyase